jgi:hypothetical protein
MDKILALLLLISTLFPLHIPPTPTNTFVEPFTVNPVLRGSNAMVNIGFTTRVQTVLRGNIWLRRDYESEQVYGAIYNEMMPYKTFTLALSIPSLKVGQVKTSLRITYKNDYESFYSTLNFTIYTYTNKTYSFVDGATNRFVAGTFTVYNGSTFKYVDEVVSFETNEAVQELESDLIYPFSFLKFTYQNEVASVLRYRAALFALYDVVDLFPAFTPTSTGGISFFIKANWVNKSSVEFGPMMSYYVNKTTGYMSVRAMEGYTYTKLIYFPKNKLELNKLYRGELILSDFGLLKQQYIYKFSFYASKRFLGNDGQFKIVITRGK